MTQKVLLIDDSAPIHGLVRTRLRSEPVELHFAFNGEEGLTMALAVLPDLILLDVDMLRPDGFEVCRRLKADSRTMNIPVVFLSSAGSTEDKIRGLDLGAVDYVLKPFDPAELRARVRASLRTKYLMDLLSAKAMIDGLTGLWNRAYFDVRLVSELAITRRTGQPLSCVIADIDRLKQINDTYGHPAGDEVLRAVGQVLMEGSRQEDTVCRYGGEEFAILAPNSAATGAALLANRLRQAIERHSLTHNGVEIRVTCSMGIADLRGTAPPCVVEMADRALYEAKQMGRNRVAIANHREMKVA
ncbi:MAG TPA: diguanylate cyclase [Tepidisphaeraceae bacterium]|nr:diguanylate cyclase [Tepidisphaeraceae bacterium]